MNTALTTTDNENTVQCVGSSSTPFSAQSDPKIIFKLLSKPFVAVAWVDDQESQSYTTASALEGWG